MKPSDKYILKSEFRSGFFTQSYILLAGTFIGSIVIYFLLHKKTGTFLTLLISLVMFVAGLWTYKKLFLDFLTEFEVFPEGIKVKHILHKKSVFIPYDEIENIQFGTFQIENLNGPLTETIPEMTIRLKNNDELYISSNIYGNFFSLAKVIIQSYNEFHVNKKIDETARTIYKNITGNEYKSKQ